MLRGPQGSTLAETEIITITTSRNPPSQAKREERGANHVLRETVTQQPMAISCILHQ